MHEPDRRSASGRAATNLGRRRRVWRRPASQAGQTCRGAGPGSRGRSTRCASWERASTTTRTGRARTISTSALPPCLQSCIATPTRSSLPETNRSSVRSAKAGDATSPWRGSSGRRRCWRRARSTCCPTPWSRRVRGVFGNELAASAPDRAHALLCPNAHGGYTISVRAPQAAPHGADRLCSEFPTGGGQRSGGNQSSRGGSIAGIRPRVRARFRRGSRGLRTTSRDPAGHRSVRRPAR